MEINYKDYKRMLWLKSWELTKQYKLDCDDLFAQSNLIFVEAVAKFDDTKKTKFSTFLWNELKMLHNYAKLQKNIISRKEMDLNRLSNSDINFSIGNRSGISLYATWDNTKTYRTVNFYSLDFQRIQKVMEFYDQVEKELTNNARAILSYILKGREGKRRLFYESIKQYFYDYMNWSVRKINKAFSELKNWYKNNIYTDNIRFGNI